MTERPHAQHHRQTLSLADLQELTQIALSAPIELVLYLLDVVPKHVAGDDGDTALFHLPDLIPPLVGRDARIVYLAHRRNHAPSIHHQALPIPRHLRIRLLCTHPYQRQTGKHYHY